MNTPSSRRYDSIPAELRALDQWVCWLEEMRPDREGKMKATKVPYAPRTGERADSTDRATWATFAEAQAAYLGSQKGTNPYCGIGFVFSPDDPYAGLDIDKCRDPQTGAIDERAKGYIRRLNSYTEVSPSGTGVKIWVRASHPGQGFRKALKEGRGFEMYDAARYFTMTGDLLPNSPTVIAERDGEFNAIHREIFGAKPAQENRPIRRAKASLSLTDQELLDKAGRAANGGKFNALWQGDTGGYGSQSEADLALCSLLASYCGPDEGRIERLFSQSGLGQREKWGRNDYRRRTIGAAMEGKSEFYSPAGAIIQHGKRAAKASQGAAASGDMDADVEARFQEAIRRVAALRLALTDIGNARRLVELFGADLRYDHSFGQWFLWDGRRFQSDQTGQIFQRAKRTAQSIYHEAGDCVNDAQREEIAKHAKASEARSRLEAMIALAQTEPEVAVTADVWDSDPWLLNCRNGALDLRTGCLRPHQRRDLCTRLVPVDYDPAAACPLWERSLARWQPEEEVRTFLQRAVGYTLTGEVNEEVLFFTYGDGKNGKSKFTETIQALLSEYGVKAAAETFMLKKSDRGAASPELVALIGRRFVSVSEVGGGQSFSEALLKDMTGGDTMTARPLYQNEVNFRPLFKLWFYGNVRPTINGTDGGIWRRMMLIPFKVTIPEKERDQRLLPKLLAELPGILNWALAGCRQWQAEGLNPPKSVLTATEDYRKDMDTIGAFLEEKCARDDSYTARSAELYEAYTEWSKAAGEKPVTQNAFGHSLTQRGMERYRTGGGFKWRGIGLRGPAEDDEDEAEQVDTMEQEAVNLVHSKSEKSHTRGVTGKSYGFEATQGSQGTHPKAVEDTEWEIIR